MVASDHPTAIPLPPSDDTAYFASPSSTPVSLKDFQLDSEFSPGTIRPKPAFQRPPLPKSFNTPGSAAPTAMDEDDWETPRGRPSRRGGKYFPGEGPRTVQRERDTSMSSVIRHSPERSSGPESEGEEYISDSEESQFEDMDRTVAVTLDAPLSRQVGFPFSARSRRLTGRSSPGRTPAKKLLGPNPFNNNLHDMTNTLQFDSIPMGRSSDFVNSKIPPSAFADETMQMPYLSTSSPQKMNTLQGVAGLSPYKLTMENSQLETQLQEKEAEIRQLKELLSGGQPSYEDFVDFSPEKRMAAASNIEDGQLTVKKRRSPIKLAPPSVSATPIRRTASRNYKSPVKAFVGMFENISSGKTPKLTAAERKEAKRRRETQEFREFSAIDLDMLKNYLPPGGVPAVAEVSEEASPHAPIPMVITEETVVEETNPAPEVDENVPDASATEPAPVVSQEAAKPSIEVPPTPTPRIRRRRSNSAPAVPRPKNSNEDRKPSPEMVNAECEISKLQERVALLETSLETAHKDLEEAKLVLVGEQRARKAAEETRNFLEMERKYGVCCKFGHSADATVIEAAATIALPSSPAGTVASYATTDENRPKSRMERPGSRMESSRPGSRLGGDYAKAGRKRGRDEPASAVVGRKPQVARPEKRVLSAGAVAGNVILGGGGNSATGLAKKPVQTVNTAPPPTRLIRSVSGGSATTRALARGARR